MVIEQYTVTTPNIISTTFHGYKLPQRFLELSIHSLQQYATSFSTKSTNNSTKWYIRHLNDTATKTPAAPAKAKNERGSYLRR